MVFALRPLPPCFYVILSFLSFPFTGQPMAAHWHAGVRNLPLFPNVILKVGLFLLTEMSMQNHPCYFLPNLTVSLSQSSCLAKHLSVFARFAIILCILDFSFPMTGGRYQNVRCKGGSLAYVLVMQLCRLAS